MLMLPALTGAAQAQVTWDFGVADALTAAPLPATVPANLAVSEITRGNHNETPALLSVTSASAGYDEASGGGNAGAAAKTGAFDPAISAYFEFTLTPAAGFRFSLSSFSFATRSTATGPKGVSIRSSADGFTADIATDNQFQADSTWELLEIQGLTVSSAVPLTLRLYGHSGTGNNPVTANWRVDDIRLDVTVTANNEPAPQITAFTPSGGAPGTSVTITGTNFGNAPAVSFGGVAAPGAAGNPAGTEITVSVPSGAVTGPVSVSAPGGVVNSATPFTVAVQPALTLAISPESFSENTPAAEITAAVSLPEAAVAAVTVTLTSSDVTELTVPATVTIPAGSTSAAFTVTPVLDGQVDANATVTVIAAAPGYAAASAIVTVRNIDAAATSVVVNKYLNAATDMIELLAVGSGAPGSAVDMRGMLIKDFTSAMANDGGGKFRFNDNPLFQAVQPGTLLVLSDSQESPDTEAADFVLHLGLRDVAYFTAEGGTFNIAGDELVMIKGPGAPAAGVEGAIHALASTNGTPGAQYDAATSSKLLASGLANTGMAVIAANSTSAVADYSGDDAQVVAMTADDFGIANNPENDLFIQGLRGPQAAGGYSGWASAFPEIGAAEADADGDGLSNFLEYALGGLPNDASSAPLPQLTAENDRLTLFLRKGAAAAGDDSLVYTIESSTDLQAWTTDGVTVTGAAELTGSIPLPDSGPRRFLRLRVSVAPAG